MTDGCLVIGIGCNILSAPHEHTIGKDGGRPATCLAAHNEAIASYLSTQTSQSINFDGESAALNTKQESIIELAGTYTGSDSVFNEAILGDGDFHKELAIDVCNRIKQWLDSGDDSKESVLEDFRRNMDLSIQRLRDENEQNVRTEVAPLALNSDGTLQVL